MRHRIFCGNPLGALLTKCTCEALLRRGSPFLILFLSNRIKSDDSHFLKGESLERRFLSWGTGIFLLSVVALTYEVALSYEFGFMSWFNSSIAVLSIAMFGFGVGCVAGLSEKAPRNYFRVIFLYCIRNFCFLEPSSCGECNILRCLRSSRVRYKNTGKNL